MKKIGIVLIGLVLVNILGSYFFFRWDLTEEKRYSISDATKNMLGEVKDEVYVKVYLDGDDFPAGFKRLQSAVQETLDEFKLASNQKVNYRFISPTAETDPAKRAKMQQDLVERGLVATNLVDTKGGSRRETVIFPWAIVSSNGLETPVLLLKGTQGLTAEEKLNQSNENVEYEIATAIRKLTIKEKKRVGLLSEFTTLPPARFAGMITALQQNYDMFIVDSKQSPSFEGLDAIILPKPDKPIDDSTKFKIDQFIVGGGRALFFVDGLRVENIGLEGSFAQPLNSNLDDLFFKYGIRLNANLVKDGQNSAMIPMNVGVVGDRPNVQLVPYRFYPLINNFGKSLITNNIDIVYSKFASTIDTIQSAGIQKTPLLQTSAYTKVLVAPAMVSFNEARTDTKVEDYKAGVKTIGILLEGRFESLYKNRIFATDARSQNFKAIDKTSKIIVCSDGDLIVNDLDRRSNEPLPLGFDGASNHIFGNQDFVMNALDYLIDNNGIIAARGKDVKIRPLDKLKIRDDRTFWQAFNLILPVVVIALFGYIWFMVRKRRFGRQ
jgi:ABC-2 type transport system permease protein